MAHWLILHGGALGDLALTLHLALRLPGVGQGSTLHVISRVDPGDLSDCRPSIRRISPEGIGLHWLHADGDDRPHERLCELIGGRRVLNALGDIDSPVHRRLLSLGADAVFSFDPRPDPQSSIHITMQWQSRLEGQGLLIPKCIHQHRGGPRLIVPEELCAQGWLSGFQESEGTSRPTAGTGSGRYARPRGGAGRYVFTVPGGRLKVAQGASPGIAADPQTKSPSGAIELFPILIHPGSGGRAKCWPLACFVDVARRLRESGELVRFVAGPVEAERWPAAELEGIRTDFPLIELPPPNGLLSLLAGARVLISNDAGPAHLAALLGIPSVTIFGPTSPAVWRPLGPNARYLQGDPESNPEDWGIDPAQVAASATAGPG